VDDKKLKALVAERAKGLKTETDLNQFSHMLAKVTVETVLNAELTDHPWHEKNAPKTGPNTRNDYSSKTLLCDDGEIELITPRDRENTFEPQLIKKNWTRITQMDSQILSLYAKGMITREIVSTFNEIYDADVPSRRRCQRAVLIRFSISKKQRQLETAQMIGEIGTRQRRRRVLW